MNLEVVVCTITGGKAAAGALLTINVTMAFVLAFVASALKLVQFLLYMELLDRLHFTLLP